MKKEFNFKNIKGMLSRDEMKAIKGGSGTTFCSTGPCSYYESGNGKVNGTCITNSNGSCVCKASNSSVVWSGCDAA